MCRFYYTLLLDDLHLNLVTFLFIFSIGLASLQNVIFFSFKECLYLPATLSESPTSKLLYNLFRNITFLLIIIFLISLCLFWRRLWHFSKGVLSRRWMVSSHELSLCEKVKSASGKHTESGLQLHLWYGLSREASASRSLCRFWRPREYYGV